MERLTLVAYDGTAAGAAYISEIMWGTDASQDDATKSQWIEIANATSAAIGIGENKWALWFYQANETPRASVTLKTMAPPVCSLTVSARKPLLER